MDTPRRNRTPFRDITNNNRGYIATTTETDEAQRKREERNRKQREYRARKKAEANDPKLVTAGSSQPFNMPISTGSAGSFDQQFTSTAGSSCSTIVDQSVCGSYYSNTWQQDKENVDPDDCSDWLHKNDNYVRRCHPSYVTCSNHTARSLATSKTPAQGGSSTKDKLLLRRERCNNMEKSKKENLLRDKWDYMRAYRKRKADCIGTPVCTPDPIFLPINIKNFHWYVVVVDARKREIHVLDSIGKMDRADLNLTVKGLHRHIKLAAQHKELNRDKWKDLEVATWPIIEKFEQPIQKDGTSCGLWMINFMEYWTGSRLSDTITQDDIKNFRFKLPAILWASRLNKRKLYQEPEQRNEEKGSPSDVEITDAPDRVSKPSNTSQLMESDTSPCILSRVLSPTKKYDANSLE
ncbi:hypothetical protein ACP4OV_025008 [Aristida adscensionis]